MARGIRQTRQETRAGKQGVMDRGRLERDRDDEAGEITGSPLVAVRRKAGAVVSWMGVS
ncbi:MAG: hypothetical protein OXB94_07305 [Nitrospira sp.]|nr:hypothetical protein [Nitrospira sp.]